MAVVEARLCFLGASHAAQHLRMAAAIRGFPMVDVDRADVVFVSEDTPILADGTRDMEPIRALIELAAEATEAILVITSQVEPGFTRALGLGAYHQSETLRMSDAGHRAMYPEQMIVGTPDPQCALPAAYQNYLDAFECPVTRLTIEEAEFAKIAINMALAAQVDYANRMGAACDKLGINWFYVSQALRRDRRIGHHAYLKPGRWQDSMHLLRDAKTLEAIERA